MAVKQLFANNASALLAASITDVETTIQLDSGYGALFPNPGTDEYFVIALESALGDLEICKVTDRTTDLLTVVRGWDGTTAQAWTNGVTRVELRNTKGSMEQMLQRTGDTMSGDLDMDGNDIIDTRISGTVVIDGAEIVAPTIRSVEGSTTYQMEFPAGDRPTIGGETVLTLADIDPAYIFTPGMIIAWYGQPADVPAGWAICDGNNGTPDLRDRFVIGAGSTYALDATGGSTTASGTTGSGGSHTHTGTVAETVLNVTQIPSHRHESATFSGSVEDNGNTGNFIETGTAAEQYSASSPSFKTGYAGGGLGHTHDIDSMDSAGSHTHSVSVSTIPPYYGLYYIMKLDTGGGLGAAPSGVITLDNLVDVDAYLPNDGDVLTYDTTTGHWYAAPAAAGATALDDLTDVDAYVPNDGDTIVYDVLSGKWVATRFSGGQWTSGQATQQITLSIDVYSDVQIDCARSNVFKLTLTENVNVLEPIYALNGQTINLIIVQGGAGSYTITWDAVFKFPSGSSPILSTAVGAIDMVSCQYDADSSNWYCAPSLGFA